MVKDHYTILECDRTDSIESIKAKYRKLVLKHHPDKNGGVHTSKFYEINEAYKNLVKQRSIVIDLRQNARQMVL